MRPSFFSTLFLLLGAFSLRATELASSLCLTCDVPAGLAVGDLTGTAATLSWNAVSGATGYELEAEDEQNNPSNFHLELNVSTNSYAITGLQAGVLYKFKVHTRCGDDHSDWSEWFFFTPSGGGTGGGGNNGPCDPPAGLTAAVGDSSATLSWNAVGAAGQYQVEIEDEQNVPSTFHVEVTVQDTFFVVTGLQAGVLYKFKVRSVCTSGQSDYSDWKFFTAGNGGGNNGGPCTAPTALSAALNGTSATLSWNAVGSALQYELEIEDEQNVPGTFHVEVTVQDTFFVVTDLQAGVLYKFKVKSICASGQSDDSAWQFFNGTIGSPPGHGGTGNCTKPTNHQAGSLTATTALLSWDSVPGVVSYSLEIERVQQGVTPFQVTQTVTANSFLLTGLSPDTRYKFKVRANCSATSHSKWTGWRKFKTPASLLDPAQDALKSALSDNRQATDEPGVFALAVWPNPAQNTANIRLSELGDQPAVLRVYDLSGRLFREKTVVPQNGRWEGIESFEQAPEGIYLLQVQTAQANQITQLLIRH